MIFLEGPTVFAFPSLADSFLLLKNQRKKDPFYLDLLGGLTKNCRTWSSVENPEQKRCNVNNGYFHGV